MGDTGKAEGWGANKSHANDTCEAVERSESSGKHGAVACAMFTGSMVLADETSLFVIN